MKVLLDTHTFLYAASEVERFGSRALTLLRLPATIPCISLASLWEMAIKERIGKLHLPIPLPVFWFDSVKRIGLTLLPIDETVILKTRELDLSHRDPFDRLLAAQALTGELPFLSRDRAVDEWGVDRIWD